MQKEGYPNVFNSLHRLVSANESSNSFSNIRYYLQVLEESKHEEEKKVDEGLDFDCFMDVGER